MQTGTRKSIEAITVEASRNEINLSDFSDLLFDCIDMNRPATALYLIDQGANPEVYARVGFSAPPLPSCASSWLGHFLCSVVRSLRSRRSWLHGETMSASNHIAARARRGAGIPTNGSVHQQVQIRTSKFMHRFQVYSIGVHAPLFAQVTPVATPQSGQRSVSTIRSGTSRMATGRTLRTGRSSRFTARSSLATPFNEMALFGSFI